MTDVRAAEPRARGAVTSLVERARVTGEAGVPEVDPPRAREGAPRPGGSRRKDAVEHVDPRVDHLEDPFRIADAHEVARPRIRQELRRPGGRLEGGSAVLSDREPADRVAVEAERGDLLGGAAAQLGIDPALRDPEAKLAVGARRVD